LASIDVQAERIFELLDALDNTKEPQAYNVIDKVVNGDRTFELRCTFSRANGFQIESDDIGHLSIQDQSVRGIRERLMKWIRIHRKLHHDGPKPEEDRKTRFSVSQTTTKSINQFFWWGKHDRKLPSRIVKLSNRLIQHSMMESSINRFEDSMRSSSSESRSSIKWSGL
jgi:hypothetical protein